MSQTQDTAAPAASNRRGNLLRGLFVIVVLLLAALALWYFMFGRWFEETDDAYVQGNQVQITPLVAGTVVAIAADDGMRVERGQLLVQLDPADTEVALQQAEANLARTVRQVRGLFSNVDGYRAEVATRKVALAKAEADYKRRKNLADDGAISQEELAHARDALDSAKASLTSSEQQLNTNRALVDDTQITSHPDVKAAAAQLRQAYLDDARSTIVAPVTGYVAKRSVQVGQRVQPGNALMAVVPLDQIWIDANFKETQLKHMRIGQPVEIRSDLYGSDVRYSGTVDSLGVGTGSAFSLLPAQNATGNWIKIVQRVPVRIHIDPQELQKHPLRIGLSMDVKVDLHDQSGPALAQQPPREALFSTDVYQQQLASADKLIARVRELGGQVQWILETHVHADHLSAAAYLKQALGGQVAIGSRITQVQKVFGTLFNAEPGFARDGSQFDVLLDDNGELALGTLKLRALHTPGHTPACMTYLVQAGDECVAFVGDTLFMPDYGTARCDFPGADARTLYRSIQRILALPDATRLFMCHDYTAPGRDEHRCETSVGEQRRHNVHVREGVDEEAFVAMRQQRGEAAEQPRILKRDAQVAQLHLRIGPGKAQLVVEHLGADIVGREPVAFLAQRG